MLSRKKNVVLLFSIAVILTSSGCYYDKSDLLYQNNTDCNTVDAKFSTAISPLMQSKCSYSGCHDAATGAGNAVLETYAQISAKAGRINQRCVIDRTMPTGTPLSASEVASIKCWVDAGAPNN